MIEPTENSLHQQIYQQMQQKDTWELMQIWLNNDRQEWSDDAFDIVHTILMERVGSVPEQIPEDSDSEAELMHDPEKMVRIAIWSNTLAWIILVAGALLFAGNFLYHYFSRWMLANGILPPSFTRTVLAFNFMDVLTNFGIAVILFLVLQGLTQLIYIFVDTYAKLAGRREQKSIRKTEI
jgi:hypothetical protein